MSETDLAPRLGASVSSLFQKPRVTSGEEHIKTILYERLKAAGDETVQDEAWHEAAGIVAVLHSVHKQQERYNYMACRLMADFCQAERWKTLGYSSFYEFVTDQSTANRFGSSIPKSSAYRYRKVGLFMEAFGLYELDYNEDFMEEYGIKRLLVYADEAETEVDELATREVNRITSRVGVKSMERIVGLLKGGYIQEDEVKEMIVLAMTLSEKAFVEEVNKRKGVDTTDAFLELSTRGLLGPCRLVRMHDPARALEEVRKLLKELEAGMPTDDLTLIKAGEADKIAAKTTTYVEVDGAYYVYIEKKD